MKKLTLTQLVKLSEVLESPRFVWLVSLIDINNKGKINDFFEMLGKKELLEKTLFQEDKQLKR